MIPPIKYQRCTPAFPGQIMPGMAGYRVCSRCVMDTTHREVEFDSSGVCNYCHGYDKVVISWLLPKEQAQQELERKIGEIKSAARHSDYDCVLGVSGGVDSSYLALKCKDWGLRPLLVQFDNGWNTELANHNIERLCQVLNFDLHTQVVDWPEFRDLQMSFLKAGVTNFDIPNDHGIFACIYLTAAKHSIRWLLTGVNYVTEAAVPLTKQGIGPSSYGYGYSDLVHLNAIHRRFGQRKLKTFPKMGFFKREMLVRTRRVRRFDPLNYIPYLKQEAIEELQKRVGWRPYSGKHFESVVTRFHQSYMLPVKFGLDKRKLHLSGLIWSGQLNRDEALTELEQPVCASSTLSQDREFFIKKMGLSAVAFDAIMDAPPHDHSEYPNIDWLYKWHAKLMTMAQRYLRR